jgi:type II secretory pathway component PulL
MVNFSEQEGMLIANTVLSHKEATDLLKQLLVQTKDNQSYAAALKAEVQKFYNQYLQSEKRTHTLNGKEVEKIHWSATGTDEIKTIYELYCR